MSVSENHLRDIRAGLACEIAKAAPKGERLDCVSKMLRVDFGEAKSLIMRGNRLAKERAIRDVIGDAAA